MGGCREEERRLHELLRREQDDLTKQALRLVYLATLTNCLTDW